MSHMATAGAGLGDLYGRISQFYAEQMRLLDTGAAEDWAATFTEDGVFRQNIDAAPLRGRAAIAAAARHRVERLRADGLVRRHWLGMVRIDSEPNGTVRTRYYAMAMATGSHATGDGLRVYASTVAEDVLVASPNGWLVADRRVLHDGVA